MKPSSYLSANHLKSQLIDPVVISKVKQEKKDSDDFELNLLGSLPGYLKVSEDPSQWAKYLNGLFCVNPEYCDIPKKYFKKYENLPDF
ncbi:hypothetical protein MXB_3376, partial [Myxobolus squamalis]